MGIFLSIAAPHLTPISMGPWASGMAWERGYSGKQNEQRFTAQTPLEPIFVQHGHALGSCAALYTDDTVTGYTHTDIAQA